MPDQPDETHEIRFPDGRAGRVPEAEYLRLEALAAVEGLSVDEWFAIHLPALDGTAQGLPVQP